MRQTDQTLLEQMRITDFEVEYRKNLFNFADADIDALVRFKTMAELRIDTVVAKFYELQTSVPEIALLIGDADTLGRLRMAQRKYVLDLFSGVYDLEYVNNRLRIGLVHKRIGVEPKLYLAGIYTLKQLLNELIELTLNDETERKATLLALEKLFMFDIALVFETYIRSLVSEIETSKNKSEQYARSLEEKVRDRTRQLEDASRTDPLTGLFNVRDLSETLTKVLRLAERRHETVSLVYIDINDFKQTNDTHGHQRGDEVLRYVASSIRRISRIEDSCFRYGGDEFCIILPNCTQAQAEEIYIRRLYEEMYKHEECISLSIGCSSTGPEVYCSPEELIHHADAQMYIMKSAYKAHKDNAAQDSEGIGLQIS
ncbi:GGDEF domain-containing protein [Chitinibacter sp. GC72]|uniref:GGDEF domain-containing protein n=1 Tax=Chitinibacter sp. GC72 TaxID=1526917 RepID=UPI0012F9BD04|nr:GGDEF domain-containing protein [Chitinibacter sp. GC72]